MIIKNQTNGTIINNFDEWKSEFFVGKKEKHWKPRRSAMSTAQFWLNKESVDAVENLLCSKIPDIKFEEGFPEDELKFDEYPNGRENDLLIFCNNSKTLVSVEAKTDEGFSNDKSFLDAMYDAIKAKRKNNNSKQPERLFDLYKNYYCCNNEIFSIMHQLTYWYAGSIAEGLRRQSENIVLFNQVFYYPELNKKKLDKNKKAFEELLSLVTKKNISIIEKNVLYGPINNEYTKGLNVYFIEYFVEYNGNL